MTSRINGSSSGGEAPAFVVYVEGPRDRDLLEAWSRRLAPRMTRSLDRSFVILGGRQPARAAQHLRELREDRPMTTGLCILDNDSRDEPTPPSEPGLDYFTWQRRHIESYLLVPDAIRRSASRRDDGGRLERLIREHLPAPGEEAALREVDAKRLLDRKGPLSRSLERPLTPGRIARAMRSEEIHDDVHALFDLLGEGLGFRTPLPDVEQRSRWAPGAQQEPEEER